MPTTITFEEFEAIYRSHLADADQPSCYVAYVRAEAEVEATYGERRYKNYPTFVATRTRVSRRTENNVVINSGKIAVKCYICNMDIFHVTRGDIRTMIPHICEGCRDEIRKLIFV